MLCLSTTDDSQTNIGQTKLFSETIPLHQLTKTCQRIYIIDKTLKGQEWYGLCGNEHFLDIRNCGVGLVICGRFQRWCLYDGCK